MKFAPKAVLRRPAAAPAAADDAPAPPPRPPRGRPVVAFAGILDGRHLWLAIDAAPGSLALRDSAGGGVVSLPSDVPDDDPAFRSVRVDLAGPGLPGGAAPASYDVVLVPGGGGPPRPVWSHPSPAVSRVRTPLAADGSHAWTLERTADGGLCVVRTPQPPTVALRAVALEGAAVTLALDLLPAVRGGAHHRADDGTDDGADDGADDEPRLRLVDERGVLVHTLPLSVGDDDLLHARLALADLPAGAEVSLRVLVDDVPVRRRGDDLVWARTRPAVWLPQLFGDDPETPALLLRWLGDGTLGVRLAARGRQDDA